MRFSLSLAIDRQCWIVIRKRTWCLFWSFVLVACNLVIGAESGPVRDIVATKDTAYYISPAGLFAWQGGQSERLLTPSGVRLFGVASAKEGREDRFILVGGVPGESGQVGVFREGRSETVFVRLADDLIYDVAFDPVFQRVALACADGRVLLGRWEGGKLEGVSTRYEHTSVVRNVAFAPNGKRLASASLDGLVLVADPETEEEPIVIQDHSDKVESVLFSPDSQRVVSGSRDGKLRMHSVEGRLIRTYSKWDTLEGARPWSRSNQILSLIYGSNDQTLIVGSSQGYLFSVALDSGKSVLLKRFPKPINAVDRMDSLYVGADQLYEIDRSSLPEPIQ